ncbi:MAG: preprotein translocase subunit YajC [Acidimicrobiaceae bacterium]|nr:preprotein translocase subunit YajC [Acidimicrobiaceae bacterium]
MEQFLIIILMFGALYYLLLRPQQKREKARRELVRSLQAGDEVVTNAGIHGVVAEVEDAVVWLEVAPDVELKLSRDAIAGRTPGTSGTDADEADDGGDEDPEDDS